MAAARLSAAPNTVYSTADHKQGEDTRLELNA